MEAYRAAGIGLFVVLVGILAAITFTIFATIIMGHFDRRTLPFAALWGLLVFQVDRSILVDPHYGPADSGRWSRVTRAPAYLLRVLLAVAVALLISEALVLIIFRPEITQQVQADRTTVYDRTVLTVLASSRSGTQRNIDRLNEQVRGYERAVAAAQTNVDTARDRYDREVGGTLSPNAGNGRLAQREWKNYQRALTAYRSATRIHDRKVPPLRDQIAQLGTRLRDLSDPASAGYRRLVADSDEIRRAGVLRDEPPGWLEQERAFRAFQRANPDDRAVRWIPWLLRAILLAVDLVPLSMKLVGGGSLYQARLRDQGSHHRYVAELGQRRDRAQADEAIGLDIHRTEVSARLEREDLDHYLRTRTDHLRRPGP
ncbi:DUF4407 domain-containing protein [Micromonospora sp. NBS 11-29]|uniref:DUF4407 domain-containing protein n=1 Tax=Micromonospora sp. NBS 11-29 TaxID=1960879 RepID=UPI001594C51F|nr:DUF4407 domain-containing protein [Micromonospora sp. NBS 11-29]